MGMGFLDTLPAPLTARSRRFFSVWHGWRGDPLLPERCDIDHAALGALSDTCLLLNVRGHDDILVERSEEHTSELPSLMRSPYAVFRLTQTQHRCEAFSA